MLFSSQTYAAVDSLYEIFDAIDNIWRNPSSYMAVFSGIASFRTATDPRSFIIHVGDEEYVTIDETILCTRFRLVESILLVEKEEMELFCKRFTSSQLLRRVVGSIGLDRGAIPSLVPM